MADYNFSTNSTEWTTSYELREASEASGLISEETFQQFEMVEKYLTSVLSVVGIVVNLLNMLVFLDKSMRNATSCYLIGISVMQIGFIVFDKVINVYQFIYGNESEQEILMKMRLYLNTYVVVALNRIVYCLVMVVAFERMMAVVFPLKRDRSRLVKSPMGCIIIVIIVNFVCHIFSPITFTISSAQNGDNVTYFLEKSRYDQNVLSVFSVMSKILFVYLPLLVILVCNIILCVALKRHINSAKKIGRAEDVSVREIKERQITVSILVSTFVFFLLALPLTTNSLVINILPNEYGLFSENVYTFQFILHLGGFLNYLSLSTDFVTYVVMSSKFRYTLKLKCCGLCKLGKYDDGSLSSGVTLTSST